MRFYPNQHRFTCGVDLHAKTMYLCILDDTGAIRLHEDLPTEPSAFLAAIAPFRDDLVVGVECMFTWYWLADLCQDEGIAFVLGHALYMKAIHGAKAKNDKLDARKLAVMLRGGAFPTAFVYPREMRSTRDLLRRRHGLVRFRAELMAHVANTNSQANQPALGVKTRTVGNQPAILAHFADPMTRRSVELDLDLIHELGRRIEGLEHDLLRQAKAHQPRSLDLLRTVPGIGPILAMTILYEIQDLERFPRVQDFASYARLVTCAHESGGKRQGSGGRKIGNGHLKWAFSEAAVLFLRGNPEGQKLRNRLARKHGKGKSLSILAHRLGRAVYHMLKRNEAFDRTRFLAA
jgi:transposase